MNSRRNTLVAKLIGKVDNSPRGNAKTSSNIPNSLVLNVKSI